MNSVTLTGRIGNDLDLRESTNKNVKSLRVSLAVKGYQKDQTDWIKCVAFNGTAEYLSKYARKGSLIAVEGRLSVDQYKDKDGNNRTEMSVIIARSEILNGFNSEDTSKEVFTVSDDDMPF